MTITAIKKKGSRLIQIEVDSQQVITLDRRTFDESPYRPGSEISEEELEELIGLSEQRRSREKAYYLLSLGTIPERNWRKSFSAPPTALPLLPRLTAWRNWGL